MDLLAAFSAYLADEKRAAANTISSYLRDVHQFDHYLGSDGLSLDQAGQGDVESYVRYLTGLGKSPATVTRSVASLKCFYSFLEQSGLHVGNPAKAVRAVKAERKLHKILTSREVELLLEQPQCVDMKG